MSCGRRHVCGDFEDPDYEDLGQCAPYRVKIDCDGLTLYLNDTGAVYELACPSGTVGDTVVGTVNVGEVTSTVSVVEANESAVALAQLRAVALREEDPCLFPNTEQECTNECPEGTVGDDITVVIDAGEFNEETQALANALAYAEACAQADALRFSSPCMSE